MRVLVSMLSNLYVWSRKSFNLVSVATNRIRLIERIENTQKSKLVHNETRNNLDKNQPQPLSYCTHLKIVLKRTKKFHNFSIYPVQNKSDKINQLKTKTTFFSLKKNVLFVTSFIGTIYHLSRTRMHI